MGEPESSHSLSLAPRTRGELLSHAFAWLDDVLRHEIQHMREAHAQPIEEFQGFYVSDERVDQMLAQSEAHEIDVGSALIPWSEQLLQHPVWGRLRTSLSLSDFDIAVLLLALAPEADLKYETIYAYLNNDVTRKWPTRDLALRLFSDLAVSANIARSRLGPSAPLFLNGLLKATPLVAEHPTWRASGFTIDPMVAHALLNVPENDTNLPATCQLGQEVVSWDDIAISDTLRQQLIRITQFFPAADDVVPSPWIPAFAGMTEPGTTEPGTTEPGPTESERTELVIPAKAGIQGKASATSSSRKIESAPMLVFEGRPGNEQRAAASALATALGVAVLSVDVRLLGTAGDRILETIRAALLHQTLYGSVLLIEWLDTVREADLASAALVRTIVSTLSVATGPVVLVCDESAGRDLVDGFRTVTLRFDSPASVQRTQLWQTAATHAGLVLSPELLDTVASRFMLTPGQIRRATQAAADDYRVSAEPGTHASTPDSHLFEAARTQTRIALGALARRVNCVFRYEDLVLPDVTSQQVREIAAAIRCRTVVYDEWDFALRLPQGQGIKVLFSGPSGTGKTMAAAVIAREVGLDLYAIDLSGIVSKYIGETEKNLDRVFKAAHHANAILFFDECDALFGKRSEVKDAHDRYANIEVAYLLQKMESHEGAVILATNFSRNMDLAFSRRMQYVVEFPIPDEPHREQLWRGMFPARTPLSDDVDFPFLARHFSIAGGDIRNVALDAAFLAAQNGRVITMQHLIRAMARQVVKQGQSPSPTHFKHYFSLLSRES